MLFIYLIYSNVYLLIKLLIYPSLPSFLGFPGGKEFAYNANSGFDPWVGKIPWRKAWQPTPVFMPGESPWTEEPVRLQSVGSQSQTWD